MTTVAEERVTVTVSYTGWDWEDVYAMRSPTGRMKRVWPNGHWSCDSRCPGHRRLTRDEEAVLGKIRMLYSGENAPGWSEELKIAVTVEEMKLFLSASEKTS